MSTPAGQVRPLQRWPLVAQPSNRSESWLKDARLVNAFAEKDPNTGEWIVQKRIGYELSYQVATARRGNGMYGFAQLGNVKNTFSIFSDPVLSGPGTMFKDGTAFGTVGGLDGQFGGNKYWFTEDQADYPNKHLIFASVQHLYYTTGTGGWTMATLPTHDASGLRGVAYLDQTIYFMDGAGNIFGSAFNDPSSWSSLNKVVANSVPGAGVQLVRQLNYIIALKENSMEVFYDAGNPPPGSPLSPLAGGLSDYGAVYGTPQVIDSVLLYATSNRTVSPQIVRVDNLQVNVVSPPAVDRMLDQIQHAVFALNFSWTFKHGGHRFYGLSYVAPSDAPTSGFTLVYDIDQNLWYQWTDPAGNFWPVVDMAVDTQGEHVLQGINDGSVYLFEGDYEFPTDNGVVAPVEIVTPNVDFGTRRRKILTKMYFNSDQTPGSILYMSRSDDDYTHWSIPRRVDLSKRRPEIRQEGTFTRRAYRFRHVSPTALRIRSIDLSMEQGVS